MPITTPDNLLAAYQGDTDHFQHVLDVLFEPAVSEIGYEVWRPSAKGSDLIHDQIIKQLETADLVLCDMSALNANVFFELGIRTALDKPVSLVRDEVTARIPFDAAVLNYHTYEAALNAWSLSREVSKLANHLKDRKP
jgi:nucleoside 2-deoxyribosyltransferase